MKTLLVYLGMLLCAGGMCYGLINETSRPFVIAFILVTWVLILKEMKNAPLKKIED